MIDDDRAKINLLEVAVRFQGLQMLSQYTSTNAKHCIAKRL